jgi:methyl-accepting chemotaxis protein
LAIKEDIQDVHLKIVAGYCVNKDRLFEKRIDVDQGLIGATYRDSKKQYLTNLPKDYIKIESGLGDVTPISLLLLPLKTDDGEMHGVVELAFLKEVSETTQTFLDKVMSVIALNIHAARINHQTQILLQKSKEQTEELMAQEEEMRQNMEEMEATQEEFSRREIEYQVKIQELGGSLK